MIIQSTYDLRLSDVKNSDSSFDQDRQHRGLSNTWLTHSQITYWETPCMSLNLFHT